MTAGAHISITDAQLDRLEEIIRERSGMRPSEDRRRAIESRLGRRLRELGIDDVGAYIAFLSIGPHRLDEFHELLHRITGGDRSFGPDPQLDMFERCILPALLAARRGVKRLRIWSPACASGEEPYALAIMLHRALGAQLTDWRVEILGTDISEKALSVAIEGRYPGDALASAPEPVRTRYFTSDGADWTIDPALRSMVSFETHDLRDEPAAARFGTWDAILCRRVLAHFDREARERTLHMLADRLAPDGLLLVGSPDTLRGLDAPLESADEASCYRKAGGRHALAP